MSLILDVPHVADFDCRETVRRLWDYLDGELGEAEVRAVDAHLARCTRCPEHFAFERAFLAAMRAAREEQGASDTLRARVCDILGMTDTDRPRTSVPHG